MRDGGKRETRGGDGMRAHSTFGQCRALHFHPRPASPSSLLCSGGGGVRAVGFWLEPTPLLPANTSRLHTLTPPQPEDRRCRPHAARGAVGFGRRVWRYGNAVLATTDGQHRGQCPTDAERSENNRFHTTPAALKAGEHCPLCCPNVE